MLSYAFAVFITPMSEDLGWSKATITGRFLGRTARGGARGDPAGTMDRPERCAALMTLGSVFAAILLIAWSRVHSVFAFYAVWALIGVASAAVLYEPAFVVVATWFRRDRARAFTALTFIGGFSSVDFVPLTTLLVERFGWRSALLWMAASPPCWRRYRKHWCCDDVRAISGSSRMALRGLPIERSPVSATVDAILPATVARATPA